MGGRFWISGVVMSILAFANGFVVHGVLLHDDYSRLPNLLRPEVEAQGYFGWMLLADLLMGFGFTWIYVKGREAGKPAVGQGLRFGLAIAALMTIPMYLIYYAVQPWPGAVVVKQIVYDTISVLVMGVVVAFINQGPKSA
jgi:hypothetical protein